MTKPDQCKLSFFIILALVFLAVLFNQPPIHQALSYHQFADVKTIIGINNYWNVITNLLFAFFGVAGIAFLTEKKATWKKSFINVDERKFYLVFFIGVLLIGIGSSYYHLKPDNNRLVWDRLPMTVGFMGFFSAIIAERINHKLGNLLFKPLLLLGFTSVIYWHFTDDLRLYIFVQFFPIVAIPLMLMMYKSQYTRTYYLYLVLFSYLLAKAAETYDMQIYTFTHYKVSGHAIKHCLAALATWFVLLYIKQRRPIK